MKKTLAKTAKPPRLSPHALDSPGQRPGPSGPAGGIGLASSRPARTMGGPIPVSISNTPLPTRPTDLAGPTQPFAMKVEANISDGATNTAQSFTFPAGKRLVVQTCSMYRFGNANGSAQVFIGAYTNGHYNYYALPVTYATGAVITGSTQAMTFTVDTGSTVDVLAYRNTSSGTEYNDVSVSGYLVDAP